MRRPTERRGEAFGLYGAAQMGGLLLGPSIGAFGAGQFGGIGFVFVFSAVPRSSPRSGIALRVREEIVERRAHATPSLDRTEFPPDAPFLEERCARDLAADAAIARTGRPATRLLNRGLIAALVLNIGGYFGSGTYEVIWSLFLEGLGADLALIGLTFAMFGLPVLLFSPFAGRIVDRRGPFAFIVLGMVLPAITGILYTLIVDPGWPCRSSSSRRPASRCSIRPSTRSSRPTRHPAGRRRPRGSTARPARSGSSSPRSSTGRAGGGRHPAIRSTCSAP